MNAEPIIAARVYHIRDGIYYVKVELADLGMYISGITVRESPKFPEKGLWVQMPGYQIGKTKKYKRYVEFRPNSPTRSSIEEAARKAVAEYEPVITDLDQEVNLDDIFGSSI